MRCCLVSFTLTEYLTNKSYDDMRIGCFKRTGFLHHKSCIQGIPVGSLYLPKRPRERLGRCSTATPYEGQNNLDEEKEVDAKQLQSR